MFVHDPSPTLPHTLRYSFPDLVPTCSDLFQLEVSNSFPTTPAAGANPWPFLHWPDYQQQHWKQLVQAAQQAAREGHKAWKAGGGRILGNDCHAVRAVFIRALQQGSVCMLRNTHRCC